MNGKTGRQLRPRGIPDSQDRYLFQLLQDLVAFRRQAMGIDPQFFQIREPGQMLQVGVNQAGSAQIQFNERDRFSQSFSRSLPENDWPFS